MPSPRLLACLAFSLALVIAAGYISNHQVRAADTIAYGPLTGGVECGPAQCSVEVVYRYGGTDSELTLEYWTEGEYGDKVSVKPSAKGDHMEHFLLTGLSPDTAYEYRILSSGMEASGPHAFMTFPPSDQDRSFRFVVFSDARTGQDVPGYEDAAKNDYGFGGPGNDLPAFMLQIGDFSHADPGRTGSWASMHKKAVAGGFTEGIAANMHVFHIWDDRDYAWDGADGSFPDKAKAKAAFLDHFPKAGIGDARAQDPGKGLWQSFRYAQAEFFILDTRYHRGSKRSEGLTEDMRKRFARHAKTDDAFLDSPSMLGNEQLFWLLDSMDSSDAKWKFIATSSVWNRAGTKRSDSWNEFPQERDLLEAMIGEILLRHKDEGAIDGEGVILLSGDLETGGAFDPGSYNRNAFPEISVPHSNMDGGQPSDSVDGPGEWYYLNPGRQSIGGSDGIKDVSNAGYAIIEVHAGPRTKRFSEIAAGHMVLRIINIPSTGSGRQSFEMSIPLTRYQEEDMPEGDYV